MGGVWSSDLRHSTIDSAQVLSVVVVVAAHLHVHEAVNLGATLAVFLAQHDLLFVEGIEQGGRMAAEPYLRVMGIAVLLIMKPSQDLRQHERMDLGVEFVDDKHTA